MDQLYTIPGKLRYKWPRDILIPIEHGILMNLRLINLYVPFTILPHFGQQAQRKSR